MNIDDNIVSEDGFVNLLNGIDLEGWRMAESGRFRVIEHERALESEGGMGLLWYTKKMFGDFIFKIDWKVRRENDNSGIFVRFSDPDNDPWIVSIKFLSIAFTAFTNIIQTKLLFFHIQMKVEYG